MGRGRPKGSIKKKDGKCNYCKQILVAGKNWIASDIKENNERCRQCCRDYKNARNRTPKGKIYVALQNKKTITSKKKYEHKIPAGIYAVYNNDEIIYIGESKYPSARKCDHFTIAGSRGGNIEKNPNIIAKALGRGELQRDNLVFKMLEFIDDTPTRKQQEQRLIQRHIPKYNDLYV
tara:strand:- start:517 stop:1047 length:531 start_codon:yes stop_codon:yes gene_type:complete